MTSSSSSSKPVKFVESRHRCPEIRFAEVNVCVRVLCMVRTNSKSYGNRVGRLVWENSDDPTTLLGSLRSVHWSGPLHGPACAPLRVLRTSSRGSSHCAPCTNGRCSRHVRRPSCTHSPLTHIVVSGVRRPAPSSNFASCSGFFACERFPESSQTVGCGGIFSSSPRNVLSGEFCTFQPFPFVDAVIRWFGDSVAVSGYAVYWLRAARVGPDVCAEEFYDLSDLSCALCIPVACYCISFFDCKHLFECRRQKQIRFNI